MIHHILYTNLIVFFRKCVDMEDEIEETPSLPTGEPPADPNSHVIGDPSARPENVQPPFTRNFQQAVDKSNCLFCVSAIIKFNMNFFIMSQQKM